MSVSGLHPLRAVARMSEKVWKFFAFCASSSGPLRSWTGSVLLFEVCLESRLDSPKIPSSPALLFVHFGNFCLRKNSFLVPVPAKLVQMPRGCIREVQRSFWVAEAFEICVVALHCLFPLYVHVFTLNDFLSSHK